MAGIWTSGGAKSLPHANLHSVQKLNSARRADDTVRMFLLASWREGRLERAPRGEVALPNISLLITYQQADITHVSIVARTHRKQRGMSLESVPPEEAIPYLLKSLHHSLRQAVDELFRQEHIELSFAHFATLYALDVEPGVAGAELARRGFVTAQTMNTLLRRLEKDGDIERRPNPANARADCWFLTRAGQRRFQRAKAIGDFLWKRMLSTLKPAEVTQLQNLLQRCITGLDAEVEVLRAQSRAAGSRQRSRSARRSSY
jgi:DNA-binding MarR family transcriptional regulator